MNDRPDARMRAKLLQQREDLVRLQSDLRLARLHEKKLRDQLAVLRALLYSASALLLFAVLGLTGALQ